MKNMIRNEWIGLIRNRLFLYLSFFFIIALMLVTGFGALQNQIQIEAQQKAHQHIRKQWDEMEPGNPHGAAHFGTFAFKPGNVLNSIDEGVNAVTGNVLRIEGHTQNELVYSEASQSLLISKFGKLKPSLLLQFLIPLFLIFLAFNTYNQERESGRLKLILVQGISLQKVLTTKIISIWLIGLSMLLVCLLAQVLFNIKSFEAESLSRLLILILSYGTYYLIITTLSILLSAYFRKSTASLTIMMAVWVLWTIFLPKIISNAVEKMHPLPSRVEFQKAMAEDRSKGLDGHNPTDERDKELEKATLAKYNVDSLAELPINFDGIRMQADEDYGNKVWEKHFGNNYNKLKSHKKSYQLSGLINPFASVQNLSMAATGTDMLHHIHFLKSAEDYRRTFIKTLNDKHAYGGSKTGDWGWKADSEFFKSVKDFEYKEPTFDSQYSNYIIDFLALFIWSILLLFLVKIASSRISII
jgi:ABC-2 type transport system permease protein